LALPSQDAQDVVLRRGQGMFPQQPGAANLKLVARANDAQGRLLFRRLEGPSLLEFVLQLRGRHMAQLVKFVQLQIVYISSICMSSLSRAPAFTNSSPPAFSGVRLPVHRHLLNENRARSSRQLQAECPSLAANGSGFGCPRSL